jgi:hypothetical protein
VRAANIIPYNGEDNNMANARSSKKATDISESALTYDQAAEYLGIKKSTVKGLVWRGVLLKADSKVWFYPDRPLLTRESVTAYNTGRNSTLVNAWLRRRTPGL